MRWFVEVSRVGENGVADEYCVEAKQWQAALQEARKLRGDTGALSKFSIELLDRGYRAVDPALKLRYLINEAPADAPLTGSAEASRKHANKAERPSKPRVGESVAPPSVYATSLAPTPFTTSLAPPANPSHAPPATSGGVPRPTSHAAPRPGSVVPPRATPDSVVDPRRVEGASPAVSLPAVSLPAVSSPAVSSPAAVLPEPPPPAVLPEPPPPAVLPEPPRASQLVVPADPVPPAPKVPSGLGLAPEGPPPAVPPFELVRQRAEEPRADSPITYREFAYAVEPGRTRDEIEALLRDRYRATRAGIEDRPPGKFVQLAVFDHVFKRRPERPPLATFAWKDWRGEPVLAFPGFGDAAMPPISRIPPARESVPPPANAVPSGARTSVAPESAPVVPMKPVVISSLPPPLLPSPPLSPSSSPERPAAPPPPVDVEITIDEAAAIPAVDLEIPIDEAAPSAAIEVEIPIDVAASEPAVAPSPIAEPAPSPVVEAPPQIVEGGRAPVVEGPAPLAPQASPTPAEPAAPSVEDRPAPAVEAHVSVVEGGRLPVTETSPATAPAVEVAPAPAPAPSFELTFEAPTVLAVSPAPAASNPKSAERASRPRIAAEGRRRAGEDLIGELFEIMHDLHFATDVAEGAEFVLSVLNELLPCEGVLIHVFDINTSHFVVVRAKGPHANSVLLQRMSDQDPLVRSVMRNMRAVSVKDAADDARFTGPRWQSLGVAPRAVLCGGVQLGGRYLGLLEVANPQGNVPFHQSELHALDYICEQFAAFLSKKPIVLSADVVLSRG